METIDYSKVSITAKLVAYFRRFSDIPFAEDVAVYIHAEEALKEIARHGRLNEEPESKQQEMANEGKASSPMLEARYKSIVELIKRTGIKQILELASGFSLRGLAMAEDASITYIETDLADVNAEKQKLIALLREKYGFAERTNHHVLTANALNKAELDAAANLLDHSQALLIINEGLIPYLSFDEQTALAKIVRQLLSEFNGGAWITPDFMTQEVAIGISDNRKRFREAINKATERPLHSAAFESEQAINEFISHHDFKGESWYQTELVSELASLERLQLRHELLEKLKPFMRIYMLTPQ